VLPALLSQRMNCDTSTSLSPKRYFSRQPARRPTRQRAPRSGLVLTVKPEAIHF